MIGSSPRVRGTRAIRITSCTEHGSSPRVRGTPRSRLASTDGGRFIPACAGNARDGSRDDRVRDGSSPRVRGTRAVGAVDAARQRGSSPRVRGTPGRHRQRSRSAVHPRVCGERDQPSCAGDRSARFIPACAGNAGTAWRGIRSTHRSVHPRVCGERARRDRSPSCNPVHPRVCGERWPTSASVPHAGRFIPACAGNTPPSRAQRSGEAVHPRVCGERRDSAGSERCKRGSSPRVRGTRRPPSQSVSRDIDGSSPRVRGTRRRDWLDDATDHGSSPRVRGTRQRDASVGIDGGSSPRVRGTRYRACRRRAADRFIPACAGNARAQYHAANCRSRFIPACAGNAPRTSASRRRRPVHPRVCGERDLVTPLRRARSVHPRVCGERSRPVAGRSADRRGSSPRVRGTRRLAAPCSVQAVHPRVCGERRARLAT